MKNLLGIVSILILFSCSTSDDDTKDNIDETNTDNTYITFNNSSGISPVIVYSESAREEQTKIVELPNGSVSPPIKYSADTNCIFYFTYTVFIDDIPISYIPLQGRGQEIYRIDKDTTNSIVIPSFDTTLPSLETTLSNDTYIVIQNTSAHSMQLLNGNYTVNVNNVAGGYSIINSGEKAMYKVNAPQTASAYRVFVNSVYKNFPAGIASLERGFVYDLILENNGLSDVNLRLKSPAKSITITNVSLEQGANANFSYTKYRDTKTDEETGETAPGDNTIEFYANSARLNGAYWSHPADRYDYSGQILESQASNNLPRIAIWVNRAELRGFEFEKQPDGALQLRTAAVRHLFYKQ